MSSQNIDHIDDAVDEVVCANGHTDFDMAMLLRAMTIQCREHGLTKEQVEHIVNRVYDL